MPDREKVMTWLEICGKNNDCSGCCPYSENGFGEYGQCRESLMADAYDLLKGQEAVKPPAERKIAHWVFGNTMGHSWMKCSECCVSQSGQTGCWTYCPNCGVEMKGDTEVEID